MAGATADVVMVIPATTASAEALQYFRAGQRAMDVGRFVDANAEFQKAVEVDPDFARAYLNAANTANSLDEFRTNLELAGEYAEGASEAEKLLIERAQKGFDNDVEGQLQLANQLVELEPTSPRAWLALAGIQAALSNHEEERASAMKAADLSPGFAPAYAQLGNSYLFNEPKDFSRAEEYMQKVVDLEPEEPLPYDFLGDVYRAQNELEKARDAYTRSADLDPTNGLPLQQRGHVNSFLGDYDEARADYDAAIALGKANEKAAFAIWRALVSVHAGYPQAAIDELNGLVEAIDDMGIPGPSGLKIFALSEQAVIALHHGLFTAAERALELRSALMMEQAERVGTDEFRRGQEAGIAYFEGVLDAQRGDYGTASTKAQ